MVKEKKEKPVKDEKVEKVKRKETKKKKETKKIKKSNNASLKSEFSKIKWPTKKEMVKYSVATILFTAFLAVFFYVIELVMALIKSMV